MKFQIYYVLAGILMAWATFVGCSKRATEAPPASAVEQADVPQADAPAQTITSVQITNTQQINANWDAVSKDIARQNYDDAVRAWVAMDQAQRQAKMSEGLRAEYARRAYQMQEALRQKAETDLKAREAYQALGRAMMGR